MSFDLSQFITNISSSKTFNTLFAHPIWSALLILIIILLIMYCVMNESYSTAVEESGESENFPSFWRLLFRSGVYMSITLLGIIFLHYKIVLRDFEGRCINKQEEKIVESTVTASGQGEPTISPTGPISTLVPISHTPTNATLITTTKTPVFIGTANKEIISGAFNNVPSLSSHTPLELKSNQIIQQV